MSVRLHLAIAALAGFAVLVLFAYAISCVTVHVGLPIPSLEVVNKAS